MAIPTVWVAISLYLPQIVLRAFRPGPYPMHAARAFLFSPRSLLADMGVWATSLLGVMARCVICGFFFYSLPVMLSSKTPKLPTDPPVRGFPWCLETSPPSRLPPWDRCPSLTLLSLFLSFIFCPTSFQREWAAFLGAWCPLPVFRSSFVEFA